MKCPQCQATKSEVTDSRPNRAGLRRRRKCVACGHRWTTYEMTIAERAPRIALPNQQLVRQLEPILAQMAATLRRAEKAVSAAETAEEEAVESGS